MTPYIPPKDADLVAWSDNFAALITLNFASYGVTSPQAVAMQGAADDFRAAYDIAVAPATRTTPSIADKDATKVTMLLLARPLAQEINANPAVTDMQRADLGITVRDLTPTPIPSPVTVPLLSIIGATNLQHILRYADETTPAARKKPFGAIQIELWAHVGTTPPAGPGDAKFVGLFTKNPVSLIYESGDAGKTATVYGRWTTRRGLTGPWSLPATMTIATE